MQFRIITGNVKATMYFLGVFQTIGFTSLSALTFYSMFSTDYFFWLYLGLILTAGLCTIGLKYIDGEYDDNLGDKFFKIQRFLKGLNYVGYLMMIVLVIINLLSILHNANLIDQFFGVNYDTFQVESFIGHLMLEILYLLILFSFM